MMKKSLLVLVAASMAPVAFAQSQTVSFSYSGLPLPILRDDANVATVASIFVPRALTVQSVRVTVDIDYPRPGDLNVFFFSPLDTRTKLLERNCGESGTLRNIMFDDFAPRRYADACPAPGSGGSYRGNEPLANSQGQNAFGIWTLAVENNGSNDFVGRVVGFTITITGTPAVDKPTLSSQAIVSASSYLRGDVAPGDLLDVFGLGLGPARGMQASAGNLPLSLGGTQATIGGRPVAIRYTSSIVLQVQLPYDVPGGDQDLVVSFNGQQSDPVRLPVTFTHPGLFTKSPMGTGEVAAVNQDGKVNSSTAPAPAGTVVALYATGLGTLSPNLATGQSPPSSPLSTTTQQIAVVIDGVFVPVLFSGAAPGLQGTYQVNIMIPGDARSGLRSLTLYGNGVASQSGVGIWIN